MKLGQTNGERGDDQAIKQANGRRGEGTVQEKEWHSTGVRQDRDWPIEGLQWDTGMMPGSCG
jgi:hypothetical protein